MKQPGPDVVVAGKYCLEGQLASGGMGSVWVARHLDLGIPVAIKFMGPEVAESEEGRIRFEREAKAAALLQSPHVVNVQDYGVDDGLAYIVMELLIGEDLDDRIHQRGRISLEEMLVILAQTAKALRRAQDLGIVHRDIKPQNLFLTKGDDGDETVKVLDFGIAKETGPTLLAKGTNTGQIIGSPHYMSPEAVRGARDVDHRSDLWSLGVITFQAVTGKLPFDSDIVGDVMGMILADPLPRATDIAPDLPPSIDAFFEKALARDRAQRFQSAREMTEAFAAIARPKGAHPSLPPLSLPTPTPAAVAAQMAPLEGSPISQEAPSLAPAALSAPGQRPSSSPAESTSTAEGRPSRAASATQVSSGSRPSAPSPLQAQAEPARGRRGVFVAAIAVLAVAGAALVLGRSSHPAETAAPGAGAVATAEPAASLSPTAATATATAVPAAPSTADTAAPAASSSATSSAGAGTGGGTAASPGESGASGKRPQASRQTWSKPAGGAQKTPPKPKRTWGF